MFGYQTVQSWYSLSACLSTLIAVSVYGDNAVGILVYHDAMGIHTEGTDIIFELLCAVNDLAFI